MDHIAHIKNTGGLDNNSVTEEKVSEHCKAVALLARSYSASLNLENTVNVSALLHDMGKLITDLTDISSTRTALKEARSITAMRELNIFWSWFQMMKINTKKKSQD